jgi:bacterioferritin-associated ferredoxin
MIVCDCEQVIDKTINTCVDRGANTLGQVARACGAGTQCGGCHNDIRQLVEHFRAQRDELRPSLAAK